jgi:hypothetical protein
VIDLELHKETQMETVVKNSADEKEITNLQQMSDTDAEALLKEELERLSQDDQYER